MVPSCNSLSFTRRWLNRFASQSQCAATPTMTSSLRQPLLRAPALRPNARFLGCWENRLAYGVSYRQAAAMARSRAMALRGVKLLLCADTYLPTALAMSVRHDPLAKTAVLFS